MNRANRDHDRVERIIFATRDCLPGVDHLRGQDNRILCFVRVGAVAANTTNCHVYRIDVRVSVSGRHSNVAGLQIGLVMKAKREVGFAESIIKIGLDQRERATGRFFRRSRAVPSPPAPTSFLHEWKARDDYGYLYKSPATTAAHPARFSPPAVPARKSNRRPGSTRLRRRLWRGRPRTRSTKQKSSYRRT